MGCVGGFTNDEPDRSWTDGLSAAERVEAVALSVGEPRTANWIASEADVAHETATKYLKRFTDDGNLDSRQPRRHRHQNEKTNAARR